MVAFIEDLIVGVASCDRSPNYIDRTLAALRDRSEMVDLCGVRVFVCGPSAEYIDPIYKKWRFGLRVLDHPTWERVSRLSPKHRTVHTFFRIVTHGSPYEDILALQDDLDFAPEWLERTLRMRSSLIGRFGIDPFVLSLYYPYRPTTSSDGGFVEYDVQKFYGNQAILLNAAARQLVASHMLGRFVIGDIAPDDVMLKDALVAHRIPLFAAVPSLVQHIGITSAVEQRFHESPVFDDDG